MKNINRIFFSAVIAFAFTSCEKVEDYENVRTGKSTVSVANLTATAVEGNSVTFTVKVDVPLSTKMDFKLEVYKPTSTATFRDYVCSGTESTLGDAGFNQGVIGHLLEFPAGASTFTFTITPQIDVFKEGNEVLKLRLSSAGNGKGLVAAGSDILTVNISDYVSNDVGISIDWANITTAYGTVGSGSYLGLDNVKHDLSGYDADFDIIGDMGNSSAAGSAVYPEVGFIDSTLSTMETYTVDVTLYAPAPAIRTTVPIRSSMKMTIGKFGVWSTVVDIPFDTSTFNNSKLFPSVVSIVKTGNTYTVTNLLTGQVLINNL